MNNPLGDLFSILCIVDEDVGYLGLLYVRADPPRLSGILGKVPLIVNVVLNIVIVLADP